MNRLNKALLVGFVAFLSAQVSFAANMGDAPRMVANPTPSLQMNLFNEMLGSNDPGLNWPAYPRTWVQKDIRTAQDTNTSLRLGGSLPIPLVDINFTSKFNISYSYAKKVSFVAVTTTDARLNEVGANKVTTAPASGPALESIRRLDPASQRNYFRAGLKNPMVGFCVYELQLSITRSNESRISFGTVVGGGETSQSNGETMTETQAVYSKFFQIESTVPEMDYLRVKCEEQFQGMVRAYAEHEFNKIVIEYMQTYSSECETDNQCTENYNKGTIALNPLNNKNNVARCLQKVDATRACYVRAKEGAACPLYKKKDGTLSEVSQGYYTKVTSSDAATQCDTGLSCKLEADSLLGKFAYCRKK